MIITYFGKQFFKIQQGGRFGGVQQVHEEIDIQQIQQIRRPVIQQTDVVRPIIEHNEVVRPIHHQNQFIRPIVEQQQFVQPGKPSIRL